jgi:precorrin-2 dehydrogenase / sirohydrochlorin ferrochelatase
MSAARSRWYPVVLDLAGKPCLVVGGGRVAAQKVRGLLDAGAEVTVVAPEICDEIRDLHEGGKICWIAKQYEKNGVEGYFLAIAATDDPDTNRQVYLDGEASSVLVNSADDPENCRFILPSRVVRGNLVIAVSTGGRSPAMAAHLRKRFEDEFGDEWGILTDLLGEARDEMRARGLSSEGIPEKWEAAISDEVLGFIRQGALDKARAAIRQCLS